MRIHATQPLFAWSELEDSPSLQTLRGVLASLPDQPLLDALQQARGHGRNDSPLEVLWGIVVLSVLCRHVWLNACLAELHRNPALCRLLGIRRVADIPGPHNLSRFLDLLGREDSSALKGKAKWDAKAVQQEIDAKLSTAVFVFAKGLDPAAPKTFVSRLHSGGTVEATSPSLKLTTAEIPLYDPANFTIVCCPQADWDLAVRVMKTGRMKRLREYAEFGQGEVNETIEKPKGTLVGPSVGGKLVTRGANVCLYVILASAGAHQSWESSALGNSSHRNSHPIRRPVPSPMK